MHKQPLSGGWKNASATHSEQETRAGKEENNKQTVNHNSCRCKIIDEECSLFFYSSIMNAFTPSPVDRPMLRSLFAYNTLTEEDFDR
jgi:hypothetical protein